MTGSSTLGDIIGYGLKLLQMLLTVVLFVDIVLRYFDRKVGSRGMIHVYRMIIFVYSSLTIVIGNSFNLRGSAGDVLSLGIFSKIHDGYFGIVYFTPFSSGVGNDDALLQNSLFVELPIYILVCLITLILIVIICFGIQNKLINLLIGLRLAFFLSFFYLILTKAATSFIIL